MVRKVVQLSLAAIFFSMLAGCSGSDAASEDQVMTKAKTRVMLIGASIGKGWKISGLPSRIGVENDYEFESIAVWQFDKSGGLDDVLMRPKRKFRLTKSYIKGLFEPDPEPVDVVILKECSAYFPGDLPNYKKMILNWIAKIRAVKKQVMLVTVVPVTESRSKKDKGKLEKIREYNDWLRGLAAKENIVLIDAEKALRIDKKNRYLRDDFTSGDGSHLNEKAYKVLDDMMREVLEKNPVGSGSKPVV